MGLNKRLGLSIAAARAIEECNKKEKKTKKRKKNVNDKNRKRK